MANTYFKPNTDKIKLPVLSLKTYFCLVIPISVNSNSIFAIVQAKTKIILKSLAFIPHIK